MLLTQGKVGPLSSSVALAFKSWWKPSFTFNVSGNSDLCYTYNIIKECIYFIVVITYFIPPLNTNCITVCAKTIS